MEISTLAEERLLERMEDIYRIDGMRKLLETVCTMYEQSPTAFRKDPFKALTSVQEVWDRQDSADCILPLRDEEMHTALCKICKVTTAAAEIPTVETLGDVCRHLYEHLEYNYSQPIITAVQQAKEYAIDISDVVGCQFLAGYVWVCCEDREAAAQVLLMIYNYLKQQGCKVKIPSDNTIEKFVALDSARKNMGTKTSILSVGKLLFEQE